MGKRFACHRISKGQAQARAVVSGDKLCFYQVEPESGIVMERAHTLAGKKISKSVLIFPGGKGSSVVQADGLYQLNMHGNMPSAMIIQYPEPVLVSSAIIMEIPMVDRVEAAFYDTVRSGDLILVNADEGYLELFPELAPSV